MPDLIRREQAALRDSRLKKFLTNPVVLQENYLYISHLGEKVRYWKLPCVPDELTDSMGSTFSESTALGRSAPVQTYSSSGPRTVQIGFKMHRDMMEDVNMNWSNAELGYGEDYVENLLHALQAIALPNYDISNKAIEPPLVAVRLTNEIFIKGIVSAPIGVTYGKPILSNGKYAQISLGITITEVDPYDANSVYTNGSFRGMVNTMKKVNEQDFRMGTW